MFFLIYKYCDKYKYNDIMVDTNTTNNNTNNNTNSTTGNAQTNTPTTGCVYDKYGRSPDGQTICGIGLPSASADTGSGFMKAVFQNKCPHCGAAALRYGWNWANDPEKVSMFQGTDGNAEGHFYCIQAEGGCDADYSAQGNEHINGSSYKMTVVSGPVASNEQEAQQLMNGQLPCEGGSAGSNTNAQGGSAVLIPDKTFYGLIKQICGGIDALFIIANNMAYLLSFKDLYEYRDKYDEFIPTIKPSEILADSLEKNWTTDGFYNAVEVTYADGIVKYQNDALIQQYGENVFYYEFPDDDEETAKAKADALLSAHVRDYSLDLKLTCMYNPNITMGSWVKVAKTITNVSGFNKDEEKAKNTKKDNDKVGLITKKRKGLTISDITESIVDTDWGTKKYIQKIKDEEDETYEIEIEKNDYEIFFVEGYVLRWDKNHALIMNLHLKYGPDTPEDPVNATIGTGEISSSGSSGTFGNDCVSVTTCQLYGDHRIPHSGAGGIEYATQNPPDPTMYAPACAQGSSYEQAVKGKSGAEAFYWATQQFVYCLYADNCSKYTCNAQRFDAHECGWNCGDSNCMLKSVLDCVGIKSWVFHIDGHYHCMIEQNGQVQSADLSRRVDQYCHTVGWPAAQQGSCGCPCAGG